MTKSILDVCCGSRMFWFDRNYKKAVFADLRSESHTLPDKSSPGGSRQLVIKPDIQSDFTRLPFLSNHFNLVTFDPPHFDNVGKTSWTALKYGALFGDWPTMIRNGFSECFRVLAENGILIFKWNEYQIPLSYVLELTPERPIFGNKKPGNTKTHWLTFVKDNGNG